MDDKTVDDARLERVLDRETYAKIMPGLQVRSLDEEFVGEVVGIKGQDLEIRRGDQNHWVSLGHVRSADEIAVYLDQDARAVMEGWGSSEPPELGRS
jgi:hypothetical protein